MDDLRNKRCDGDAGGFAPMTVILTVLDAVTDVEDQLKCIEQQCMWPSELLIVDRGSSPAALARWHDWVPPPGTMFKVIEAPGACIAHARNLGVESAHYDHIAVTDLDILLDRDWLSKVWDTLRSGADVATGLIEPAGRTLLQRTVEVIRTPSPDGINPLTFRPHGGPIAFAKTVWDGVAGYPEWLESGHDFVFALTLRQSGAVIAVIPETLGSARSPETLAGYLTDCWHAANAAGRAGVTTRPGIIGSVLAGCTVISTLVFRRSTGLLILAGLTAHLRPFLRRVWRTRKDNQNGMLARLTAVTAVVLIGGTTKIVGYLMGLCAGLRNDEITGRSPRQQHSPVDHPGERVPSPPGARP